MAEFVVRIECLCACCAVAVAAFVDFKTRTIPNACALSIVCARLCVLVALCLCGADAGPLVLASLAGALAVGLPLALVAQVTGGIGGGDVKLLAALGFSLGWQRGAAVLILSCAFTVCVGCVACIAQKRKIPQTRLWDVSVPMAPQIAAAYLLMLYI